MSERFDMLGAINGARLVLQSLGADAAVADELEKARRLANRFIGFVQAEECYCKAGYVCGRCSLLTEAGAAP
jgi:hypothetical protein